MELKQVICLACSLVVILFYVGANILVDTRTHTTISPPDVYDAGVHPNFTVQLFYYMARSEPAKVDITLVTQVSVDRISRIPQIAEIWQGPLSVAVYIRNKEEFTVLKSTFEGNAILSKYCDVHLLYKQNSRYPVNNLRNLAITNARTDYVFHLDADFIPNANIKESLLGHIATYHSRLKCVFVVPAFETNVQVPKLLPKTKQKLLTDISRDKVKPVNIKTCPKCHGPTNYQKWYETNEPYEIPYAWIFEPYLAYDKTEAPLFEERMKGYGFDKNTHSFTMAVNGYHFIVLPDVFVIHMNHEHQNWDGPDNLDSQQWDALKIVCELIMKVKQARVIARDDILFGEPKEKECYSSSHW